MTTDWSKKQITFDEVADKIHNGSNVYIQSTGSTAEATLRALVEDYKLLDIQILQMIPGGNLPHLTEHPDRFRTRSFISYSKSSFYTKTTFEDEKENNEDDETTPPTTTSITAANNNNNNSSTEFLSDYTPLSITAIPRLLHERLLTVDVAILKVSRPHKGFCSLGMGVECTMDFVQKAQLVIAEVTDHMPWTEGPSKIPTSAIHYWIDNNVPLLTSHELWPKFYEATKKYNQETLDRIGENVIRLIPNGATLNFGLSPITFAVLPFLHQRQDLGLHTDIFNDELFKLQQDGIFNNSKKSIHRGITVVSQAHGSPELYEFLDRNPAIEFHPLTYVNNPQIIGQMENFITMTGALKIDLTGQVATDSIAHKFYFGVWSDDDSITGARMSKHGKSIVVMPSKSLHNRSNVLLDLPPGTGVSITRSNVEYVVTEYGIAYLYGKSIRERCLALIDIAHPDFRHELLAQAKANHYLSQFQPGNSFQSTYPKDIECTFDTKLENRSVFVRPIKAMDEDNLRSFFHKLSDHSVYMRYFRKLKSMPQRVLQKTANVDYSTNMALVALYPPDPGSCSQEIVGIAQWVVDAKDGIPEIAFQVRDDWQGAALGRFLFNRLAYAARTFGSLKLFKADVLADNHAMRKVLEQSEFMTTTKCDFGVISYLIDLNQKKEG